jgi:tetratricopeptide (TPR) repeat protein
VRWNPLKRACTSSPKKRKKRYDCIYFVIFTAILSQQFCRAQQWISVSSSQVEILTSNNESEARAALQVFENAHQFFSTANLFPAALKAPVRIFAFQSKEEYTPYRLNGNAFGHFLHSRAGDYIVLEDIKPEHYQAALHEYTHYALAQAGFHLPTWLNEGIADLYSSMEPDGTKTVIGRLLPGRMAAWENKPAISLKLLFTVTPDSPYYQESDKLLIFYAQSWALTHMLALEERYAARFPDFLKAVSSGLSSADALVQVYRKSLEQVESDLKQYRPRMAANAAAFDIQFGSSVSEPQIKKLPDEEKRLALADLLAAHPATASTALQTLDEMAKQHPEDPSIDERMGDAFWDMSRVEDARFYFARAVEHGSQNAEMIYRYAVIQKQAGAPDQEVMGLFERVLELSPGFDDARLQLGLLQFNEKRFNAAAQSLSKLKAIKPDWAYVYYSAMAYCNMEFSNIEEARVFGEKAKLSAKTLNEQSQAARLLLYLQARAATGGYKTMLASAGGD